MMEWLARWWLRHTQAVYKVVDRADDLLARCDDVAAWKLYGDRS